MQRWIKMHKRKDMKAVYSTKQSASHARPQTLQTPIAVNVHGKVKHGRRVGDKRAWLDLAEVAAAGRERHRPQPRASVSRFSTTPHLVRDSRDHNHGRITIPSVYGDARHGHGMSGCVILDCALLTRPGLESRRLLLWRCDMQRRHGLLRRQVR